MARPATPFNGPSDYNKAIFDLDESTRAIEAQINAAESLRHQIDATNNANAYAREAQSSTERQQIFRLIDTLKRETKDSHEASSDNLSRKISSFLIDTEDTLARHDHILAQLGEQGISSISFPNTYEKREAKILTALQRTHAELIRTRLDRTYLEILSSSTNGYHKQHDTRSVKADLQMLHADIDDVAQMLVMHEYGDCMSLVSSHLDERRELLQQQKALLSIQRISVMREQLDTMADHCEMLQSQRLVQQRLSSRLHAVSPVSASQTMQGVNQAVVGSAERDTAALSALRQYLGPSSPYSDHLARREQISSAFEGLTAHIGRALFVHKSQARQLQDHGYVIDTSGRDGELENRAKLDELDREIAAVKAIMDSLPS